MIRRFLVIALVFPASLWALRTTPLPEVAAHPSTQGELTLSELTDLSLILSGAPRDGLAQYEATLAAWEQECRDAITGQTDENQKGETVLSVLHRHLTAYQTYQTRVDVLLAQGTFNCVSSALVYMILGRSAGLDVQAVETPDHAFALVRRADGTEVDVETTTPYGYNPGTKTQFKNSFGQTGFLYVPPGHYGVRKTITARQLLGLLLQNRMAEAQSHQRPEDSVGLGLDRWVLEGTPEAFQTLVTAFVNAAAPLNVRQDYTGGLALVTTMVSLTGPVPEAKNLAWAFTTNLVNQDLQAGRFDDARALLQTSPSQELLSDQQKAQTRALIADWQLTGEVKSLPADQAADRIEQAFQTGDLGQARRDELLSYVYGQETIRQASVAGASGAVRYLQSLPPAVQGLPELIKAARVYRYNWSVEVHNQFAHLWNSGQRDQAVATLREALRTLPDSDLLQRDLRAASSP